MSEMGFYLLPAGKLLKKNKNSRLKNFSARYIDSFYRNLANNIDNFIGSDFYGRIAYDSNISSEEVQKCILAISDFPKGIQTDISRSGSRSRTIYTSTIYTSCLLIYLPNHHQKDFLNLFNHHRDCIALLVIFIFLHNFLLQVLIIKDYLEIYLVHRHRHLLEKMKKFRTAFGKS